MPLSQPSRTRSRRGPARPAACAARRARRAHSAPDRSARAVVPTERSRSPFASSTAASRTISVPNLVDRNPTERRGSPTSRARSPLRASRSSRVHSLVPSPTQLTVTMRSSAGRRPIAVGHRAVLDDDLPDEESRERGTGKSDAQAGEQDGARPGCDPPGGDREGSEEPPRHRIEPRFRLRGPPGPTRRGRRRPTRRGGDTPSASRLRGRSPSARRAGSRAR